MSIKAFFLFVVFFALCGIAAAQSAKEPVYTPTVVSKDVDEITATGTVSIAGKRYRLRFVASPVNDETGLLVRRSELLVFTDTKPVRQIGRVALPKGAPVTGRWSDISVYYLSPKRKSGVVVSVRGSDEWILAVFPKGFTGKGYAQVFNPSSSSIAARTFDWGKPDNRGYRTVREEYSEREGDNGEVITHVWRGAGFAP